MSASTPAYTVLVTGSAGHLGHALMLSLPQLGFLPLGLDIVPSPSTTIIGDVADSTLISDILTRHGSIQHIIHSATLHKPHVESHSKADFIRTNISGTLTLLEAASSSPAIIDRIKSFIFISTTSTFGNALSTKKGEPAAWIDENVVPLPKNIYGVTKCSAEDMCRLVRVQKGLPVVVLRTSRFFPEADDDEDRRNAMGDENLKVNELAYRRVDVEDVVQAVVCAMRKAREVGWGKYIISAPPPFASASALALVSTVTQDRDQDGVTEQSDSRAELLRRLDSDAPSVYQEYVPRSKAVFEKLGWSFLPRLDRVYDSSKAIKDLGWRPEWTFERVIEKLERGEDWRSGLTYQIGKKGYHAVPTGVYTTSARSDQIS